MGIERALSPAQVPAFSYDLATKHLLSRQLIVRPTENTKIRRTIATSKRPRLDVIQLQERTLLAATPIARNVRALRAVPLVDLTTHRARNTP